MGTDGALDLHTPPVGPKHIGLVVGRPYSGDERALHHIECQETPILGAPGNYSENILNKRVTQEKL